MCYFDQSGWRRDELPFAGHDCDDAADEALGCQRTIGIQTDAIARCLYWKMLLRQSHPCGFLNHPREAGVQHGPTMPYVELCPRMSTAKQLGEMCHEEPSAFLLERKAEDAAVFYYFFKARFHGGFVSSEGTHRSWNICHAMFFLPKGSSVLGTIRVVCNALMRLCFKGSLLLVVY